MTSNQRDLPFVLATALYDSEGHTSRLQESPEAQAKYITQAKSLLHWAKVLGLEIGFAKPPADSAGEAVGWQRRIRNTLAAPDHPHFQWGSWHMCDDRRLAQHHERGGTIEGFPGLVTEVRAIYAHPSPPVASSAPVSGDVSALTTRVAVLENGAKIALDALDRGGFNDINRSDALKALRQALSVNP